METKDKSGKSGNWTDHFGACPEQASGRAIDNTNRARSQSARGLGLRCQPSISFPPPPWIPPSV